MKKILIFSFLAFSLTLITGCGEEKGTSERTVEQEILDKKDNLYRKMARLKEDVMSGHLEGWRAKLDAFWIHGDIIDPQMADYMNEIKRIALQKEKEIEDDRPKSDLIVEPKIDSNITVTEEILTAYLKEIITGIDAGTLLKWEVLLDKVYLHGHLLNEEHEKLIEDIEKQGYEFNKALQEQKKEKTTLDNQ